MGLTDKIKEKYGDDADNYEADEDAFGGNSDLPTKPGAYHVEILSDHTEERSTKSGGEMLNLECKVKGPKYAGKHFFFRFIYDCPSNREFEEEEIDRVMLLAEVCGIDGAPEVDDWAGREFIAETGLEQNEYQGELEYRETLWGVRPTSDGPAEGPWDDSQQPDIWEEARAFHEDGIDPRDGGGGDVPGGNNQSSYDDSEIPF